MAVSVAASGTKTLPLGTVTISNASPAVVTYTAHGLAAGDTVTFSVTSGGSLPTGLTAGTTYYVIAAGLGANVFEVSATSGGAAINTGSAGSGTFSVVAESVLYQSVAAGTYVFETDLSAMAAGDTIVLAVYKTVLAAGTLQVLFQQSFTGEQEPTVDNTPLASVSSAAVCSIPASTGLANTGALTFTISQTAGVARAIPYSINKFA